MMLPCTVSEPRPGVVLLEFRSRREMGLTFLRFQEHYESPKFCGKVFSLDEYREWYEAGHGGQFSYCEDWAGYNIPSRVLAPFKAGRFNPLSQRETDLMALLAGRKGRFYVIGALRGNRATLNHELAHALYYLEPGYRAAANAILKPLNVRPLYRLLADGYHRRSWRDEAQACLVSGLDAYFDAGQRKAWCAEANQMRALFRRWRPSGWPTT